MFRDGLMVTKGLFKSLTNYISSFFCSEEKAFYKQTKAKHTWFGILQTIAFD